MQTLVLNASYEPIRVVDLDKAIYYLMTGKAIIVEAYDKLIRGVNHVFEHPKVIKLVKYVKIPHKVKGLRPNRKNILARDKMKCQYCGTTCTHRNATLDHVQPRSRGGKNSWTNLVTSCHECNNRKDNRTPEEAGMRLLNVPKQPEKTSILEYNMAAYPNW